VTKNESSGDNINDHQKFVTLGSRIHKTGLYIKVKGSGFSLAALTGQPPDRHRFTIWQFTGKKRRKSTARSDDLWQVSQASHPLSL
jgi:hypothetical protein